MAKEKKEYFHCDGYYYDNVCIARGTLDVADVQKGKDGWYRLPRAFCMSRGISPFNQQVCQHCVEHKHLFRKDPGIVYHYGLKSVTPFQAKHHESASTQVAYRRKSDLVKYLKKHPNLYGCNVEKGELIASPIQV